MAEGKKGERVQSSALCSPLPSTPTAKTKGTLHYCRKGFSVRDTECPAG